MITLSIATAASAIAAACNIALIILLYKWYGIKKDRQ